MRVATLLTIIAPVALAANTTIVAPSCTGVASGSSNAPGVNGTKPTGTPSPSATIVTAGASQQFASVGLVGALAAAVAMML